MSSTDEDKDDIDQHGGGGKDLLASKKECTSCEQNNIDNITEGINGMGVSDTSTCASCGKEGNSDDMNICNKCKSVKYCNAACKKKHRKKHKKACERRVAELYDEKLFKEIEPEECPLCLLPLPLDGRQVTFESCCGKRICDGCIYSMKMSEGGADLCAFCRTPNATTLDEHVKRTKSLTNKGNAEAYVQLAGHYADGVYGLPQDWNKAHELYLKAGELGCAAGYFNLGTAYRDGIRGVESDKKKAKHYYELAAIGGDIHARHNLAGIEGQAGNYDRAKKHLLIAARAGSEKSLDAVKEGFTKELMTKDEYANTLRAYHERQKEMRSDARDKAAAADMFQID